MTDIIGRTPQGVPIAAWMVKGNPTKFDVGTGIANMGLEEEWRWSLANSYRVGLMERGQTCFLWVTNNDNPDLVSGIWVACEVTGPCYVSSGTKSLLWADADMQQKRSPYVPLIASPLVRPVTRGELLAHPVLKDLEVLRAPQMSNPQIITPAQLIALRSDFDLSTGELDEDLGDRLRTWYPSLSIYLRSGGAVEVYEEDDGSCILEQDGEEVDSFPTWQEGYRVAATVAIDADLAHEAGASGGLVAESHTEAGRLAVIGSGDGQLSVTETTADDEVEWVDRYVDLSQAVEAIIEYHESLEKAI